MRNFLQALGAAVVGVFVRVAVEALEARVHSLFLLE